jgi:formylglycine-generating enzyme required for sulfatase activity
MAIKIRPSPAIPDHEVLRKIGGGAYGEVWLARGVTGALRAVKVVWREDFEDTRGFEREFEGVLKYEPMSRDHPALVNILHVGRSPDHVSFYYYVMELGDDVASGQDINPIEYEPRTLRADNHQGPGLQWDINTCIDVGLRLAEALGHLHEKGLAHRDVKPSNVIFVNGRAKLADIGLVAARGQRTFVGTEGFVPPEGPGSTQADVYSLGKVLYEIATGKDRMSFPEVPDEIPLGPDRKRWLEMNRIICDICEPRISKRKISTAADLAEALRLLQRGKKRRQVGRAVFLTSFLLVSFAGWAAWQMLAESPWAKALGSVAAKPAARQTGLLRVVSAPDGAEVTDMNGNLLGVTNAVQISVTVGDRYFFTLKRTGYRPYTLQGKVPATVVTEPLALFASLENFTPPQIGEKWNDHLGNPYQPVGDAHLGSGFVTKTSWSEFSERDKRPADAVEFLQFSQNGQPVDLVLASEAEAQAFCKWFQVGGLSAGFLTEDHEVLPVLETSFENPGLSERARRDGLRPFRVLVRLIEYGEIVLTTQPPGVEVWMNALNDPGNRISVGSTLEPLLIPKVRPAEWQLYLVREGYKPATIDLKVGEGEKISKQVTLEKSLGVVFGKPWDNGVGMRFVPLGQDLLVSIWETRLRDYEAFVSGLGLEAHRPAFFPQDPDHPVVNVSRVDAEAFCKWLTDRERKDERIAQTHLYRLPTDLEWSRMVGLDEEPGISPGWRDARKQNLFPWGTAWPPAPRSGNFADVAAARTPGVAVDRTISDYDDGFAFTAPVGSFPPNSLGIYDLSGNVQEWVADEYSKLGKNPLGVLRGGGWNSYQPENLYSGSRNAAPPTFQDAIHGFRIILAKLPLDAD